MAGESLDFAIFGSSPMALLIAGVLAGSLGKKVCVVGEDRSAFRLARGADVSVAAVTRPETWAMLQACVPEVAKLVTTVGGRSAFLRISPLFIAETPLGAEALSHMRHTALGFDQVIERVTDSGLAGTEAVYRIRDALTLARPQLEPALLSWHAGLGITHYSTRDAGITVKRDGSARIETLKDNVEAAQSVLVDSSAIAEYLDAEERDRVIRVERSTAILTEPTRPLLAPVMVYPDSRVLLSQRPSGGVAAISHGRADEAAVRVGACLAGHGRLRRAGQMAFTAISTTDGAPLIGHARGTKAMVVTGFGTFGAFLAPAIARHLAGAGSEFEKSYFTAREPGRGNSRDAVSDYQPEIVTEVAA
jgi:hypothetical protein